MQGFFECIEFYKIPASVLMREVHPLSIVPDHIIMNALAYQVNNYFHFISQRSGEKRKVSQLIRLFSFTKADPKSIDIRKVESPNRFRRMTLPHPLNISGSELLHLHRQSLTPFKSERSASTSTSGYATEFSLFSSSNSAANVSSKESKKKNKEEKPPKVGKRRASRPFRRAMTLFESK